MKTLVIKMKTVCKEEQRKEIVKEIAEGIKIGVLVLNPYLDYEVVEYDSYLTDIPVINKIPDRITQVPEITLYRRGRGL